MVWVTVAVFIDYSQPAEQTGTSIAASKFGGGGILLLKSKNLGTTSLDNDASQNNRGLTHTHTYSPQDSLINLYFIWIRTLKDEEMRIK